MELGFGILAAVLVLIGFARLRRRQAGAADSTGLTDDAVRRIEDSGRIEREDPLDLEEIEREHERFFEETWDEPEEF